MRRHIGNRYHAMRRHKRTLKQKYAISGFEYRTNLKLHEDKLRDDAQKDNWWNLKHPPRNGGYEYWKQFQLSGRRGYAKTRSNRRIRQHYREMIAHMDPEDVPAFRGSQYETEYDYKWEIW